MRGPSLFIGGLMVGMLLSVTGPDVSGRSAELIGITRWLNVAQRPSLDQLRGKVVLVSFWTYSCINCIRTMPNLKSWYAHYHDQGLEIIAVHTPEFHFEKNPENVQATIKRFGIPYPVAMDDDYRTWDAFGSRTWPSDFLIDAKGVIRFKHFGEAHYEVVEEQIRQLLAEIQKPIPTTLVSTPGQVDFSKIKTRQIYLGLLRLASLGNSESIRPGQAQLFAEPRLMKRHKAYLVGQWLLGKEFARLVSPEGKLLLRFEASRVNIVLSREQKGEAWAEVWIDGKPATEQNRGQDVEIVAGQAKCKIDAPRMYNLTQSGYGVHELEIRFKNAGVQAYTLTFG